MVLQCGHSACKNCCEMEGLLEIRCPECCAVSSCESVMPNATLVSLLKKVEVKKESLVLASVPWRICFRKENVSHGSTVQKYCSTCNELLCSSCIKSHEDLVGCKNLQVSCPPFKWKEELDSKLSSYVLKEEKVLALEFYEELVDGIRLMLTRAERVLDNAKDFSSKYVPFMKHFDSLRKLSDGWDEAGIAQLQDLAEGRTDLLTLSVSLKLLAKDLSLYCYAVFWRTTVFNASVNGKELYLKSRLPDNSRKVSYEDPFIRFHKSKKYTLSDNSVALPVDFANVHRWDLWMKVVAPHKFTDTLYFLESYMFKFRNLVHCKAAFIEYDDKNDCYRLQPAPSGEELVCYCQGIPGRDIVKFGGKQIKAFPNERILCDVIDSGFYHYEY